LKETPIKIDVWRALINDHGWNMQYGIEETNQMDFPLFLACCEQSPIAPNSAEKQEKR
jgi:hypothetical protein